MGSNEEATINGDVYVLSETHRELYNILPKTALVSNPSLRHNLVLQLVYFEGNMYGALNLGRYIERVSCAWGRMANKYPTAAMIAIARDHLIKVGEFESNTKTLRIDNADALAKWLGVAELDHRELVL
jgi:hypothetical protein